MHGSDETNTSKFITSSSFTRENRSFVRLRPNKAVNVSSAPPSRDSGAPKSGSRLNSIVKSKERNNSVYTNPPPPPQEWGSWLEVILRAHDWFVCLL